MLLYELRSYILIRIEVNVPPTGRYKHNSYNLN